MFLQPAGHQMNMRKVFKLHTRMGFVQLFGL